MKKLSGMSLLFRDADLEMMRLVKNAMDAKNLSNPGKLIP